MATIKKPSYPKEILDYARTLYPDLAMQYAGYDEETDSNEPIGLGQEINQVNEEDEMSDLPDINQVQLESGKNAIEQAKRGLANFEKMTQQRQKDEEDYNKTAKEVEQGGPLQPLEAESDTPEDNTQQYYQNKEQDLNKIDQEKQLDTFMNQQMQKDKFPKYAPTYEKNIMEAMKEKQKKEDMYDLWESIGKVGSAFGNIKHDSSAYEKMRQKAGRPLENLMLEKKLEQDKAKQDAQNILLTQQVEDAKAKSNPNSELSQFTRDALIGLGMESLRNYPNVTYSQMEKMFPTLTQALYTQFAAKAKVAAQKISSQAQQQKILQDNIKFQQTQAFKEKELQQKKEISDTESNLKKQAIEVNKQIKNEAAEANKQNKEFTKGMTLNNAADTKLQKMYKDIDYDAYSKSDEAISEVDDLIKRKIAEEDVKIPEGALFFKYAKIAQGDSSVVRESDIKNLAGGTNVNTYLEKLAAKVRGEQFTVQDLQEMKKVVEAVKKVKKEKVYQRHVKPIRTWANKYEYDLSNNVGSDLLDDIDSEYRLAEEAKSRQEKLQQLQKKAKIKQE